MSVLRKYCLNLAFVEAQLSCSAGGWTGWSGGILNQENRPLVSPHKTLQEDHSDSAYSRAAFLRNCKKRDSVNVRTRIFLSSASAVLEKNQKNSEIAA
jgi:hypothetical protein